MNYGKSISMQELLAQPTEQYSQGHSPWRADLDTSDPIAYPTDSFGLPLNTDL